MSYIGERLEREREWERVEEREREEQFGSSSGSVVVVELGSGKMMEGRFLIRDTDMPAVMQVQATAAASQALDLFDVVDCRSIAAHIKKDFDESYGFGWQCVVGPKFGCYFTHEKGTFIYFCLETLNFLVFRGTGPSSA